MSPRRTNRRRSSESRLRDLMSSNSALISAASNLVKTILLARSPSSSPSRRCSRESERRHLMPSSSALNSATSKPNKSIFSLSRVSLGHLLMADPEFGRRGRMVLTPSARRNDCAAAPTSHAATSSDKLALRCEDRRTARPARSRPKHKPQDAPGVLTYAHTGAAAAASTSDHLDIMGFNANFSGWDAVVKFAN